MSGKETSDVIQTLHNIRRNPNDMKYYDTQNSPKDFTVYYNISYCWFPGCLILKIYMIISDILQYYEGLQPTFITPLTVSFS